MPASSIVTIVTPPTSVTMVTLARVKQELNISELDTSEDEILIAKIGEASDFISRKVVCLIGSATIEESRTGFHHHYQLSKHLKLKYFPVESVTSIVSDGVTLATSNYKVNNKNGLIYNMADWNCDWYFNDSLVIRYVAGFHSPEDDADASLTVPLSLQSAACDLVNYYHKTQGRDPSIKAEENVGVFRFDYSNINPQQGIPQFIWDKIVPFTLGGYGS